MRGESVRVVWRVDVESVAGFDPLVEVAARGDSVVGSVRGCCQEGGVGGCGGVATPPQHHQQPCQDAP